MGVSCEIFRNYILALKTGKSKGFILRVTCWFKKEISSKDYLLLVFHFTSYLSSRGKKGKFLLK